MRISCKFRAPGDSTEADLDPKVAGIKCHVCGAPINLTKKSHYIARAGVEIGLSASFGTNKEPVLYDAVDCPICGCQNILGVRERMLSVGQKEDDDDEE